MFFFFFFFLFFKMFKRFEKVVRVWKKWSERGKNGVKMLTQSPHMYTTKRFYVDDGLASLSSVEQAIDILNRTQKEWLWSTSS